MIAIRLRVHVMLAMVCLATSTLPAQENWQREHNSGAKAAKAANFAEAETLLSQSADEARKAGNANLLARSLVDLAEVYRSEGKYTPSQTTYNEALQLYTKQDGAESPAVAEVLNGQAELFKILNDYAQAEPLLLRALEIRQKKLPQPDLATAQTQNDLGELYTATGAYDKATSLLPAALDTRTHLLGPEHEDVAQTLEALANLDRKTGKDAEAENPERIL